MKTPIREACEVMKKRQENDKTLKKKTNLNVYNIMELLIFILWTTYFTFGGEIYQQKCWLPGATQYPPLL